MKTPHGFIGAGELGQYFQKGKDEKGEDEIKSYKNASRVFRMHVELIAGGKGGQRNCSNCYMDYNTREH